MKQTIKRTIGLLLAMAIALTGISLDGTMTANAATTYEQFKNNASITMKPGDKKRFCIKDKNGNDVSLKYTWTSSDDNVVSVDSDFIDETVDFSEYLELTAVGPGTVTIRGEGMLNYVDISMTVTVKNSTKATAAQKKCKHSWKTTRKATCQRTGVKTCKKCHLQKEIKKTGHKWTKACHYVMEYDEHYLLLLCSGEDPITGKDCDFTVDTRDYATSDEALAAMDEHFEKMKKKQDEDGTAYVYRDSEGRITGYGYQHGAFAEHDEYSNQRYVTKEVTQCVYCEKIKE